MSLLFIASVISITSCCCGVNAAETESGQETAAVSSGILEQARVSYLGPAGTYTEEAAQFFFPDASEFLPESTVPEAIAPDASEFLPESTVPEAMADVAAGDADYAVIPQENTLGGAVTNYIDALIASEDIFVVGEVILPISQTLMGIPGASIEDIRLVCSDTDGNSRCVDRGHPACLLPCAGYQAE